MISGGGDPPTQTTNLRFAQIVEDLKNFNFGRPMTQILKNMSRMDAVSAQIDDLSMPSVHC